MEMIFFFCTNVIARKGRKMNRVQTLDIAQDILDSARLTIPELKREMAITLYAQHRLSFGKARELAAMTHWEFRQMLASRRVAPHYEVAELEEDVQTLRAAGRI
jgi:predicted HTH domain antitoxin